MSHRRHKAPLIPQRGQRYRPDVERQRAMLIEQREFFRAKGFEFEMDLEAHLVQQLTADPAAIEKERRDLRQKIANCDRSARRMDQMLAKLPPPKPSPTTKDS